MTEHQPPAKVPKLAQTLMCPRGGDDAKAPSKLRGISGGSGPRRRGHQARLGAFPISHRPPRGMGQRGGPAPR